MFDNGRVIESGTFDELVAQGGRFAELAKAQFMVQSNVQANVPANARTGAPAQDTDNAAVKI
jgi:ATP-binding cassette, subfamily B, beta-glucan exporter